MYMKKIATTDKYYSKQKMIKYGIIKEVVV